MASISSTVFVAGNMTRDPETRTLSSGTTVVRVSVASNPRQFDKDKNEWVDGEPVFWEGNAYGKLADNIAASVSKGDRVIMIGTVKTDTWIDKESGVKKTRTIVMIDEFGRSVLWEPIGGAPAPQASQDAWSTPGHFGDDTPF